jgi:hypothetical protein
MASMELTQIYLEPAQKRALRDRAKAHGSTIAEEARRAIDAHLAGVSPQELEVLDAATREAQRHLQAMADDLDRVNRRLDEIFSEVDQRSQQRLRS